MHYILLHKISISADIYGLAHEILLCIAYVRKSSINTHADISSGATGLNIDQSELPPPISWNQTSDVHRGSTLIA